MVLENLIQYFCPRASHCRSRLPHLAGNVCSVILIMSAAPNLCSLLDLIRIIRTPEDRKKVRIIRKVDIADAPPLRSVCHLMNTFLGLRSCYATIRDIRCRVTRRSAGTTMSISWGQPLTWRAWRLPGRCSDGGRSSNVARWTRRRAALACATIADLTCTSVYQFEIKICLLAGENHCPSVGKANVRDDHGSSLWIIIVTKPIASHLHD